MLSQMGYATEPFQFTKHRFAWLEIYGKIHEMCIITQLHMLIKRLAFCWFKSQIIDNVN